MADFPQHQPYKPRRHHRRLRDWLPFMLVLAGLGAGWYAYTYHGVAVAPSKEPPTVILSMPDRGRILGVDAVQPFTVAEAASIAHENYGGLTPPVATAVTKITFHYRSYDINGQALVVYGRAYLPAEPTGRLPIFAFAPGTTGIGDRCAASLEQPHVVNWGNYDSHMVTYASQGYAAVITDYEGMRDPDRIHHYMVGELEGRALLDAVRALRKLPQTLGRLDDQSVFLSGYSQGGHAAFWADKIQPDYAPELTVRGVVGFGPVMSVKETLADVVHGANINWFGPYVLTSYSDYYGRNYGLTNILLPNRLAHLGADVQAHCIDSVLPFWGNTPTGVYTPEFIAALQADDWSPFAVLSSDLDKNTVGDQTTASAKRINEGQFDNVVLPRQQTAILPTLCAKSRGPVQYVVYPNATHYNTMVQSLKDTLAWMADLRAGQPVAGTCQ
ncbi:MAG TPA: lipase family protein [Candidatus Saccharimonas sp.]|nr:lipase family protein [Candidatus Saccharimonas sp.]